MCRQYDIPTGDTALPRMSSTCSIAFTCVGEKECVRDGGGGGKGVCV